NTLNSPESIYVDFFGRLWVTDRTNHRILRFDNASSKTSGADADAVFGQTDFTSNTENNTQNNLSRPTSVWIDPAGRMWVADMFNHRVLRFDDIDSKSNGANADGVLGQANFTNMSSGVSQNTMTEPHDVFGDNAGNLFVTNYSINRALRFNNAALKSNGANADNVLGQSDFTSSIGAVSASNFNYFLGITLDHTGRLYGSDLLNNRIVIFNDVINKNDGASMDNVLGQPNFTSNTANNGGIDATTLYNPQWLYFDRINKHLWVTDYENHRVLRYTMMVKNPPVIGQISDSTMDEDTVSTAISFTVTDINEQALTITYTSSDESIISSSGITFSGSQVSTNGSSYTVSTTAIETTVTLTVTPETNQSGTSLITITVTDPDGMTATTFFELTVTSINDTPVIGTLSGQTIDEDSTLTGMTFTVSDVETADCNFTITLTSSDQSLIQDANLSYSCDSGNYTITAIPLTDQNGIATITVSITDSGGETAVSTFDLTVTAVNDTPTITADATLTTVDTSLFNLTATDIETAGCSMDITFTSSDPSLLAANNISYTCNIDTFYFTLTPTTDQTGSCSVSFTVTDSGGISATHTLTVIVLTPMVGNALEFDGTDDYVELPNSGTGVLGTNSSNEDFTIEMWVYGTDSTDGAYKFISKHSNSGGRKGYFIETNTANIIWASVANNGNAWTSIYGPPIPENQWYHVALVYTSTGILELFVNGISYGTQTGFTAVFDTIVNCRLGSSEYYNCYLSGKIDEVRIWNVVRSQTQIQENMHTTIDPTTSGLVAYYRFDHISGSSLEDLSGNNNHGTLNNMDNSDWVSSDAMCPISLYPTTISDTSFTASWQGVSGVTKYYLDVAEDSGFTSFVSGYENKDMATGTGDLVSSLSSGYTYYYRVSAEINGIQTPYSTQIVTTDMTSPGKSLDFDGIDDFVTMPNSVATPINGGTEITIEYWFKGTNLLSPVRLQENGYIVAGWDSTPKHIISSDGGTGSGILVGNAEDGNWHHIAMTWKANTTNGFKSYLDGQIVDQRDSANTVLPTFTSGLVLGSYNGANDFLSGQLDEVRIWSVCRTQSQIQEYMNNIIDTSSTGLIAYYSFDHNAGKVLDDLSPNNNDAYLQNMDDSDWMTSNLPIAPTISSIDDQSTLVSSSTSAIPVTITVADGESLTITASSSDIDLVAIENISFSGTTSSRTITITPTTGIIGDLTISVMASDSQGLT
ncbi:NHL repeat protein, partial [Candidatus Magnetomorum sp. HK-1]